MASSIYPSNKKATLPRPKFHMRLSQPNPYLIHAELSTFKLILRKPKIVVQSLFLFTTQSQIQGQFNISKLTSVCMPELSAIYLSLRCVQKLGSPRTFYSFLTLKQPSRISPNHFPNEKPHRLLYSFVIYVFQYRSHFQNCKTDFI